MVEKCKSYEGDGGTLFKDSFWNEHGFNLYDELCVRLTQIDDYKIIENRNTIIPWSCIDIDESLINGTKTSFSFSEWYTEGVGEGCEFFIIFQRVNLAD